MFCMIFQCSWRMTNENVMDENIRQEAKKAREWSFGAVPMLILLSLIILLVIITVISHNRSQHLLSSYCAWSVLSALCEFRIGNSLRPHKVIAVISPSCKKKKMEVCREQVTFPGSSSEEVWAWHASPGSLMSPSLPSLSHSCLLEAHI